MSGGLKMLLDSDADVHVINSLKKEMEAQLADIKTKLKTELTNKINEASGGALSQFGSLDDIKNKLTGSVGQANDYENKLNQKRSEAEKQMKGKAEEATKKATQQATDNAKKELGNQLKKLF
jgi:F0F1-type ATP synthase membrane subunit b/b'